MYVCMYVYSPPPSLQPLSLQPGAGWPAGPCSPTRIAATRRAASAARPLRAGGARAAGAYAAADRRRGRQSETAVEQRSKSPSTAVTVKRPLTAATVKRRRNGQTAAKGRRSPGPGGPKPLRDSTHPLGDSASKSSRRASINSLSSKCRLAQANRLRQMLETRRADVKERRARRPWSNRGRRGNGGAASPRRSRGWLAVPARGLLPARREAAAGRVAVGRRDRSPAHEDRRQ